MTPTNLPGHNMTLAEDQPEYQPLPVCYLPTPHGEMTSCWKLTWRERLKVFFSGRFYFSQWTFNSALQPQRPSVDWEEPRCPRCGQKAGAHRKPEFICPGGIQN